MGRIEFHKKEDQAWLLDPRDGFTIYVGTGTSFVNVNGETGFVVPARDSHALAVAITRLMDNADLRAQMGAAGRARVRQAFTLEKMVERVGQIYKFVLP